MVDENRAVAASRVQQIRLSRGLTMAKAAAAAGLTRMHYRRIDHGMHVVTANTAPKLAKAFQVEIPDLYEPISSPVPLPTGEFGRYLVHDPEELAWLDIWRRTDTETRSVILTLLRAKLQDISKANNSTPHRIRLVT